MIAALYVGGENVSASRTDEATIRRIWPAAVWMPWDAAPVGVRVRKPDWEGRVGSVLCAYEPKDQPLPMPHCDSCSCVQSMEAFRGYWEIAWDRWIAVGLGTFVPEGTPGAEQMVSLEWPPSLVPA